MADEALTIGIDTGGTFTDVAVLRADGEVHINKAPTTPHDFSQGVMDALAEVAGSMGMALPELLGRCTMLKHGTTVATNALITRTGSRVGFITTRGFEDTTLIMRAIGRVDGLSEDEIKHFAYVTKPLPLVPKPLLKGVRERVDFRGRVVVPLNLKETREAIRSLVEEEEVEALAVSLLFGWVNPVHEQMIQRLLREMYPDRQLFCSVAHELVPVVREYARANTVIINSFLGRTMERYLSTLRQRLQQGGFQGTLLLMQANGGVVGLPEMTPVGSLASGPAGGIIGSKFLADALGHRQVITTDMGGTSFDVGLITDGFWNYAREPIVSRFRLIQPMIEIESIGAGGGTIARVDPDTGRLLLGPQSAGAWPGPACYDQGGSEPTVTDADLVLGLLNPDYFLGGRKKLIPERARLAIAEQIAQPLGLDLMEAAAGIYRLINSHMSDLIRKQVARAGHLPEEFVIYAFGGAGPVHAAAYGAELGIGQIYVFPTAAVFSAYGIAAADIIHTHVSSARYPMPVPPEILNQRLQAMEEGLFQVMAREGFAPSQVGLRRTLHLRYRRQMNELAVEVPVRPYDEEGIREIMATFERRYEQVFGPGSAYSQAGMELISLSVDAIGPTPKPRLLPQGAPDSDAGAARKGERPVYFPGGEGGAITTAIHDFARLRPGQVVGGPAIIETPITTVVIPPGYSGRVDPYGNLVLAAD